MRSLRTSIRRWSSARRCTLTDGTVASGANRYDADTIAKYVFSEGAGSTIAYDTSGIDPAANLTLTGHYQFDGSWGMIFLAGGGKAQATVECELEAQHADPGDR